MATRQFRKEAGCGLGKTRLNSDDEKGLRGKHVRRSIRYAETGPQAGSRWISAEALADVMTDQVATKGDLRELAAELKIWTAGLAGVIIAALSAMKFFSA